MGVWLPDARVIEYVVDGLNRRVGKKVNGTVVEGFLYDGQLRPVAWLDGAGAVKATFVYGLHVNVPEYMTVTGGGTYRILTDHLGSPRLVVDTTSGAVAQRMDYDSFGQVLSDTNAGFQPFGFAGGFYDRDTGLVRFGFRDYDPSVGRWTSKDPLMFGGGDTNVYAYVANDPVNYIDPLGLKCRSYWQRVGDNFMLVNKTIPGLLAPIGLGVLTTGPIAQAIGGIGPVAWAWSGFGGATLGGVSWTALETGVIAGATGLASWGAGSLAFEVGVGIGSLIEAAFEDGGKCDDPCGG
jgi:RHS repeat-associated protein